MQVFTDNHHGDLYYSLHLLFERRLGHELYSPIGWEWFTEGYWKIGNPYPNPEDTANQYLTIPKKIATQEEIGQSYLLDDVYYIYDAAHQYHRKAITLDKFHSMKFDVIMPSFPGHDRVYETLRNKFQPQAKMIMQMGNLGQRTHLPNVLHSNSYPHPDPNQNRLRYHQEIDPDLFQYTPPVGKKKIYSVVNCAPCLSTYDTYRKAIADVEWRYYGGGSPDGPVRGAKGVSEKMKEANIGWHLKPSGGVGHSTKGWFAIGRPMVTNMQAHHIAGGDALALFEPGVTCIDIESGTVAENEKLIRQMLRPDENLKWCKRVNRRFNDIINYDRIAEEVKAFLERLK